MLEGEWEGERAHISSHGSLQCLSHHQPSIPSLTRSINPSSRQHRPPNAPLSIPEISPPSPSSVADPPWSPLPKTSHHLHRPTHLAQASAFATTTPAQSLPFAPTVSLQLNPKQSHLLTAQDALPFHHSFLFPSSKYSLRVGRTISQSQQWWSGLYTQV